MEYDHIYDKMQSNTNRIGEIDVKICNLASPGVVMDIVKLLDERNALIEENKALKDEIPSSEFDLSKFPMPSENGALQLKVTPKTQKPRFTEMLSTKEALALTCEGLMEPKLDAIKDFQKTHENGLILTRPQKIIMGIKLTDTPKRMDISYPTPKGSVVAQFKSIENGIEICLGQTHTEEQDIGLARISEGIRALWNDFHALYQ